MRFLGDIGALSPESIKSRFEEYNDYLKSIQAHLPPDVYAFATAPWHHDDGKLGLHDSWLESLTISEPASGNRSQNRAIEIRIRLLSAYQEWKPLDHRVREYSILLGTN